jgi:hypothetical protein
MHLRSIINLKQNIMKNLFLFLTVMTCTFQSCSSDDGVIDELISEEPVISPFEGTWRGTWDGDDSGTWTMEISVNSVVIKSSFFSVNGNATYQGAIGDVISTNGSFVSSPSELGGISMGQFTGETVEGTWENPTNGLRGTFEGKRE